MLKVSNVKRSRHLAIAKRLVKEFWLAACVATAWTAYNAFSGQWSTKTLIAAFASSFFLASWATGQVFRVRKQIDVDKNLSSIEARLATAAENIEVHMRTFLGYATGADSIAYFVPMISAKDVLELGLMNTSEYPVYDIQAEVIDLDEPIDPHAGKFWTRHAFSVPSLYQNKMIRGAYRISLAGLKGQDRLRLNMFIHTRTQSAMQQIRLARKGEWFSIAVKTTVGDKVIENKIPEDFPGLDPADPEAVFK